MLARPKVVADFNAAGTFFTKRVAQSSLPLPSPCKCSAYLPCATCWVCTSRVPPFADVSLFAGSMLPVSKSSHRRPGHGEAPPAPPSVADESPPGPPPAFPPCPLSRGGASRACRKYPWPIPRPARPRPPAPPPPLLAPAAPALPTDPPLPRRPLVQAAAPPVPAPPASPAAPASFCPPLRAPQDRPRRRPCQLPGPPDRWTVSAWNRAERMRRSAPRATSPPEEGFRSSPAELSPGQSDGAKAGHPIARPDETAGSWCWKS